MAPEAEDMDGIVVADSVTKLGPECRGRVVIAGSHGGVYAAYLACAAGVRGVILNDAGRGRDDAGVSGGAYCQALGIPYAAIETRSARIGDGADMAARGVVGFVNEAAERLGVSAGMACLEAARAMRAAPLSTKTPPPYPEARKELPGRPGERRIVLVDSVSLVSAEDVGRIVVTGSHGGVLGRDDRTALKVDAFAALFNDAGGGADDAGLTRLAPLDRRGIAACTVAAMSARIGDGASTYEDGVISHANERARALGAEIGMAARTWVDRVAKR